MNPYAVMVQVDPDDRFFAESALDELKTEFGIEYISRIGKLQEVIERAGEPTVILVNDSTANPAMDILNALKNDPSSVHIPVVILGEYASRDYIRKYYRAGASSYVIKPSTIEATRKKIESFFKYWFEVAEV